MKTKNLKNLKQYRVKSKFWFYVQFRPRAQRSFFPIIALILLIFILKYEYERRGVWEFNNTSVVAVVQASESAHSGSPETNGNPVPSEVGDVSTAARKVASPDRAAIETIQKVARETETDWKLLWSICQVESHCDTDQIGDGGKSYGAFQIFQPVHKGTSKLAFDLEWSARWTAEHGKDYKDNPAMFFKKHNGIAKTTNQWYIDRCMEVYKTL